MDHVRAQEVFRRATTAAREGDPGGATKVVFDACMSCLDDEEDATVADAVREATALIIAGSELCAFALRQAVGDPDPAAYDSDRFYSIEMSAVDGRRMSFEDLDPDPSAVAAMRCLMAGLNRDYGLLSSVLLAHVRACGVMSVFEVVSELINLCVLFGEVSDGA